MSVYLTDREIINEIELSNKNGYPTKNLQLQLFQICDNFKNYYKVQGIESNDLRTEAFIQLVEKWNNFQINGNKYNISEPILMKSEIIDILNILVNIYNNKCKNIDEIFETTEAELLINHITIVNKYLDIKESKKYIIEELKLLFEINKNDKLIYNRPLIMKVFKCTAYSPFAYYTQIAKNQFFAIIRKFKVDNNKRMTLAYNENGELFEKTIDEVLHEITHKRKKRMSQYSKKY